MDKADLSANQRRILDLVRLHQPVERASLTAQTGLTQQSVHRIVTGLQEMGLITARAPERGKPGKPSPLLSLVPEAAYGVGLLLNTDSAVLCLVDMTCRIVARRRIGHPLPERATAWPVLKAEFDRLLLDAGTDVGRVAGLGFALPGYLTGTPGHFNAPEPLKDWSLTDFRSELHAVLGLEADLENSATAGAIGESLIGAGQTCRSFAYLAFDYGFGGGIVLDGEIWRGHNGNAGEVSHFFTTEESAHRPALRLLLAELKRAGVAVAGLPDLHDRFDPAWPGVARWLELVMPQVNRVVHALQGFLDPEAIVFGGQVPPALARMMIDRIEMPREARYGVPLPVPDLLVGQGEADPAALGAAIMPLKNRYF